MFRNWSDDVTLFVAVRGSLGCVTATFALLFSSYKPGESGEGNRRPGCAVQLWSTCQHRRWVWPQGRARYVCAGRRQEGGGRGREGRKDVGKELQWAALPVLKRHQLNFKHHLLFDPRQEGRE